MLILLLSFEIKLLTWREEAYYKGGFQGNISG